MIRDSGGEYVAGETDEERIARFDAFEDLAQQLAPYAMRKQAENPIWSLDETMARVESGVASKVTVGQWELSTASRFPNLIDIDIESAIFVLALACGR